MFTRYVYLAAVLDLDGNDLIRPGLVEANEEGVLAGELLWVDAAYAHVQVAPALHSQLPQGNVLDTEIVFF